MPYTGAKFETDCFACTEGFECFFDGGETFLTAVKQPCSAGYYCPTSSTTKVICPAGHYCEGGNAIPEPCPVGTYTDSTSTGNSASTDCLACPDNKYCPSRGSTENDQVDCGPGFVCTADTAPGGKGAMSSEPS